MKRTLFQLFNLLMACIVLLSSTGFGLVEHSCQMRGKKKIMVVAFSEAKSGPGCATDKQPMPPSGQTTLKKTECCQDNHRYENVDVHASLTQLVAKFVKTITETVLAAVSTLLTDIVEWLFDKEANLLAAAPSPPFSSGRAILTFVCSLLI